MHSLMQCAMEILWQLGVQAAIIWIATFLSITLITWVNRCPRKTRRPSLRQLINKGRYRQHRRAMVLVEHIIFGGNSAPRRSPLLFSIGQWPTHHHSLNKTIFVQTPDNKSIVLRVPLEAPLAMVAELVAKKVAIPGCQQRLIRRDRKLHAHQWHDGETVLLLFRLSGGAGDTSSPSCQKVIKQEDLSQSSCSPPTKRFKGIQWNSGELQPMTSPIKIKLEHTEDAQPGFAVGSSFADCQSSIAFFAHLKKKGFSRQGGPSKKEVSWYCAISGRALQVNKKLADIPLDKRRAQHSCRSLASDATGDICDAGVIVKFQDGLWRVTKSTTEHTGHKKMSKQLAEYLTRWQRLPDGFRETLAMYAVRTSPAATIRKSLERQFGECPLSVQDIASVLKSLRSTHKQTDVMHLIGELLKRKSADARWVVQYELDEGHLVRLFWMSPKQIEVARKYWQVLFHDNTYNTNKYRLALSLFSGVNEHGQTLLLGQGFLEWTEPATAYEWIWMVWLGAVGLAPRVIFTDAALAVLGSIPNCFPSATRHFLCLFHILVNLGKNCRQHFSKEEAQEENTEAQEQSEGEAEEGHIVIDDEAAQQLDHATWHCFFGDFCNVHRQVDIGVAQDLWNKLLQTYPKCAPYLQQWLGGYRFEMWCLAFQVDYFTTGNKSTQRSESLNNVCNCNLDLRCTLSRVFQHLENVVDDQMVLSKFRDMETEYISYKQSATHFTAVAEVVKEKVTAYAWTKIAKQMHLSFAYQVFEVSQQAIADLTPDIPENYFVAERIKRHKKGSSHDGEKSDVPRKVSLHNWLKAAPPQTDYRVFQVIVSAVSSLTTFTLWPAPQYVVLHGAVDIDGHRGYCGKLLKNSGKIAQNCGKTAVPLPNLPKPQGATLLHGWLRMLLCLCVRKGKGHKHTRWTSKQHLRKNCGKF